MRHTPGPWRRDGVNIAVGPATETPRGTHTHVIARMLGDKLDDFHANSALVSAAPELLEACKLAFERFKPGDIRKDFSGHVAYAALGKAIHKAEGSAK